MAIWDHRTVGPGPGTRDRDQDQGQGLGQGLGLGQRSLQLRHGLTAGLGQDPKESLQLPFIRELIQADAETGGVR